MSEKKDAYINYLDTFFKRWIGLYDYFALSIYNVHSATNAKVTAQTGDKILDICTGTGEIALRLAKNNHAVTGIDITEVMLEKAKSKALKQNLKIDLQVMDARHLDFPDNSFHTVIISNALHDMPRKVRVEVLREAARVCSKEIIITDYDFPKSKFLFQVSLKLVGLFETPYFPSFVKEGLDPLLQEAKIAHGDKSSIFPGLFSVRKIRL